MYMYIYIYILHKYIYIIYIIKYIYIFIYQNIVKETDNFPCRLLPMHQGPHSNSCIMSHHVPKCKSYIYIYTYIERESERARDR